MAKMSAVEKIKRIKLAKNLRLKKKTKKIVMNKNKLNERFEAALKRQSFLRIPQRIE